MSIAVLAGADSPERDVSLVSGRAVHGALLRLGYDARLIELRSLDDLVHALHGISFVFSCLHGGRGEDGTVQLLLDVLGIPFVGSDALSSHRAMDKGKTKSILTMRRIPTPVGMAYDGPDLDRFADRVIEQYPFPMVVKPRDGGSTLGVAVVSDPTQLRMSARQVVDDYGSLLVEEYIAGRELTVGVLSEAGVPKPLPVVEIRFTGRLFDYQAKYTEGIAEFLVPAPLDPTVTKCVQDTGVRAHEALGCRGFSRVDLRLGEDGIPYVLEVNTLPGMTPMSDLPRAAAAAGIGYDALVDRMLNIAIDRREG